MNENEAIRLLLRAMLHKLERRDSTARTDVMGRNELISILEEMMRDLKPDEMMMTDYARIHDSEK